ncbi:MAG: DUF4149 domain-containing protein [Rhodocyclaceae bacterium]|nr:DUF4149 domain-containing protein [Rhodocyclaceae bacterium]
MTGLPVAALQRVLLTAWVGALWAIGYLAVPVLFAGLDDRMQAGALAGKMFGAVGWLGVGCAIVVLVMQWMSRGHGLPVRVLGAVGVMLALGMVGLFVVAPIMADLKAQAGPGGVMAGPLRDQFGTWHGVSSMLYLCQSLLGVYVVWRAGSVPTR